MSSTMALGAQARADSPNISHQQMPITFLHAGESAKVLKVRGNDELHHHLENLGFVPGADVKVIAEQRGSMIIEVKGTQVALDRSSAGKVITN